MNYNKFEDYITNIYIFCIIILLMINKNLQNNFYYIIVSFYLSINL